MKKRGVSSTEVARLAGVSRTTVSFVLNSTPGKIIPEETRTRVIEAARTLNYVPDEHAKRVAKSARMTVGFLVSHSSSVFSDAYILRLIEGMAPLLNKRRCSLMLVPVKQRTTDYLGIVKECGLDGVIMTNTHQDDAGILALAASNVPLVVIGTMNEVDVCQIDIDNRQAARQTVEYLIGLGHRRIGLIAHAPLHYYASQARKLAYEDALSARECDNEDERGRMDDVGGAGDAGKG